MPDPLQSLTITGSDYGADTSLAWEYPVLLPTHWKLLVFYHGGSAVTDQQIADYCSGSLTNAQLSDLGIHVFSNLPNDLTSYNDFGVEPGLEAFYSAIIQDTDNPTSISTTVTASYTPTPQIAINTIDTKGVVVRGVRKMLSVIKNLSGDQLRVGKDVRVFRDYADVKELEVFVVVQRISGQASQRQLHDDLMVIGEALDVKAEIDTDALMIEWVAVGNPRRRDVLTDIFRVGRQIIRHYVREIGSGDIKDIRFVPGGDGEKPEYNKAGAIAYGGRLIAQVELETQLQIGTGQGQITYTLEEDFYGN